MPVNPLNPPPNNGYISDLSTIGSGQSSPTQRSRSSSVNNPTSSIESAREAPEPKSFLTWVYEGFCHILALIWNFFSPPTESSPPVSRESSGSNFDKGGEDLDTSSNEGLLANFDEQYFGLKGSHDGNGSEIYDNGSEISGLESQQSETSMVHVKRPSETNSSISQDSSVPSHDISLSSNIITSDSNPASIATNDIIDEALYALSTSDNLNGEEALLPFCNKVIDRPLKITIQNRADIQEVLQAIGTNTAVGLVTNGLIPKLQALGANIDRDVHPYRFLIEIFTNPDSKASLIALYNGTKSFSGILAGRTTMWNEFAADLGKSFEKRKDGIATHTRLFLHILKADYELKTTHTFKITPSQIDGYVMNQNWNGLLEHLIKHTKTPATNAR